MQDLIVRKGLKNVALFSLSAEDSYIDLGLTKDLTRKLFAGIITADIMQDIYSVILANAEEPAAGLKIFRAQWDRIIKVMEGNLSFEDLRLTLEDVARALKTITVRRSLAETPGRPPDGRNLCAQ